MHDKILFLANSNLNSIEVLISKDLTASYISLHEFVFVNNVAMGFEPTTT